MNVGLVVVAYNSGGDLVRLVESARGCTADLRLELFLHSRHVPTVAACGRVAKMLGDDCRFYDIGVNQGISRAWNEGMLSAYGAGADAVIVANDDITFGAGDLDRLARAALDHPDSYAVLCGGHHSGFGQDVPSHGFSCFAWNRVALDVLGCFDENLFPAYFEDCDYSRRAVLAGLSAAECPDTRIIHEGSATIKRDLKQNERNHVTFSANSAYYERKWGGGPHQEKHRNPFNNTRLGLRIDPAERHSPYGAQYDRVNPEVGALLEVAC